MNNDTKTKTRVGRPATGHGIKVGLYLTKDRAAKLGSNPTKAIYDLIDRAPAGDFASRFLHVCLRLTPLQMKALGVSTEKAAQAAIGKLVAQAVSEKE